MRKALLLALVIGVAPSTVFAQAQTSLSSLRVGYNARKATVKPEGELKAKIDTVDRELAEASRLGQTGDVRRLLVKGTTLLAGRPWTPELEFSTSVVIRSEKVVVDSGAPYEVRLEQIYTPNLPLEQPLTAHMRLRLRPSAVAAGQPPQPGAIVKDLGTFDGVARDLRDLPFEVELDLHDVADGA